MSIAMTHSPADVIRWMLVALGLATNPSLGAAWPAYESSEPTDPDDVVTVYDTAPAEDCRLMGDGESVQRWGFQVRIRSAFKPSGYAKAEAVRVALNEGVYDRGVACPATADGVSAADYLVHSCNGNQLITLGRNVPNTKRVLWTINGTAVITKVG